MNRIQDEPWYVRNNAVEMKPWVWATLPGRADPVEVVSYPWQDGDHGPWQVMVRMTVGDPTSIQQMPAQAVACFAPSSHEWFYRPKQYYSDNATAFIFEDELTQTA